MEIFLRAKHWQLFLLTFGIPFLLQFVLIFSIFFTAVHDIQTLDNQAVPTPRDVTIFLSYFKFVPVIMLVFMGTLLGWQWSVAIGLQKMVPAGIKMKVNKFKIFFFIPVIYITLILIFVFFVLSANFSNPGAISNGFYIYISFAVIVPLHLFSMFCLFYCIYFVSKTFKTVELQREVTFNDHMGEFFLTWFFPVGVWILQPKINKMVKE